MKKALAAAGVVLALAAIPSAQAHGGWWVPPVVGAVVGAVTYPIAAAAQALTAPFYYQPAPVYGYGYPAYGGYAPPPPPAYYGGPRWGGGPRGWGGPGPGFGGHGGPGFHGHGGPR